MKIYTKTGDKGTTMLWSGGRAPKSSQVFMLLGELDELTTRIGVVCAHSSSNYLVTEQLRKIQSLIQDINTEVATLGKPSEDKHISNVKYCTEILEKSIDNMEKQNSKLVVFILPGVTPLDSFVHMCRTQARKVERLMCEILNSDILVNDKNITISDTTLSYFNRLSDYFFVLSRYVCMKAGEEDCKL